MQRGQCFGPSHRHRIGAQRFEGIDINRILHDADFQASHVGRRLDRALGVGQVAEPAFGIGQTFQIDRIQFGEHFLSDFPVQHLVGLGWRVEQERHLKRSNLRQEICHRAVGDHAHVHGADLHPFDQGAFVTQLRIGEQFNFHFALGSLLDQFFEFQRSNMEAVLLIDNVRQFDRLGTCRLSRFRLRFLIAAATGERKRGKYHQG